MSNFVQVAQKLVPTLLAKDGYYHISWSARPIKCQKIFSKISYAMCKASNFIVMKNISILES